MMTTNIPNIIYVYKNESQKQNQRCNSKQLAQDEKIQNHAKKKNVEKTKKKLQPMEHYLLRVNIKQHRPTNFRDEYEDGAIKMP